MTDYWRPAFDPEYKESIQKFLEENDEIPFDRSEAREFVKFCVDSFMVDVATNKSKAKEAEEQLDELEKKISDMRDSS